MDIGSIISQALPLAMGAATVLKTAEAIPGIPIAKDDQGTAKHLTTLGAVIVLLMAVDKATSGHAGEINGEEIVAAVGVAYVSAIGMLGALRSYFHKP